MSSRFRLIASVAVLSGCASASTGETQTTHVAPPPVSVRAIATLPDEAQLGAGDYPADIHSPTYLGIRDVPGQGDWVREYKLHVPESYDPSVSAPVVFAFHGWQLNAVAYAIEGAAWQKKSDEAGFVLVMPNGIQRAGPGGSFNAGTCCGNASEEHLDDVALMRAIYGQLAARLNLDRRRVYAVGLSNGAFFSHRLACQASDLFVAIAAVAGAIGTPVFAPNPSAKAPSDFETCAPKQPVAVLAVHGTRDRLVPYRAMLPSLQEWARLNGCTAEAKQAAQPESAGDTSCLTFAGCRGGVEVTGCTVQGGGHCWFGSKTCGIGVPNGEQMFGPNSNTLDATEAAWQFVSRFSR